MSDATRLIFEQLGISLALGLLVGLQRQRSESLVAGLRTFPLITILGTLAASLDSTLVNSGWMVPAGLVALVALVVTSHVLRYHRDETGLGMTTEAAILLMYLVGAYVVMGDRIVAVAVGAGVAVLLQFKPELHGVAERLGDTDLRAIMTFALITCVILPVLPNTTYDVVSPLNILNPFRLWLMVVLMVGVSLGAYLIYKFFGKTAGFLLGGILGGLISSTATTVSYARRSQAAPNSSGLAALAILLASTVVYGRVMFEIFVVAPRDFLPLATPIAIMMSVSLVASLILYFRQRGVPEEMPLQKNPTQLKSALIFAVLYAGVLMGLSAVNTYLDGQGLFLVAFVSGLTDMDAITLSAARMVELGPEANGISTSTAWRLIVVATLANHVFKFLICVFIGSRATAWRVGALFALPMLAGGLLLLFWP